jgi:hypothetical protein
MTTVHNPITADPACILEVGDHPSIKQSSYIFYRKSFEANIAITLTKIIGKHYRKDISLSADILKKIQNGAKKSKFFPTKYKKYFDYF